MLLHVPLRAIALTRLRPVIGGATMLRGLRIAEGRDAVHDYMAALGKRPRFQCLFHAPKGQRFLPMESWDMSENAFFFCVSGAWSPPCGLCTAPSLAALMGWSLACCRFAWTLPISYCKHAA